jgi:hypothetical protein
MRHSRAPRKNHADNSTKKHTAAKNQQAAVVQKIGSQLAITGCNSALTILRIGANFNHRQALCIGQMAKSRRITSADFFVVAPC